MKKDILPRDYPYMNFDHLKIILVSSTENHFAVMSSEAQEKSEKYLKDLGVTFMSGEVVTDYDGDKVHLKSGKEIPSNNVIWAAGVTGNVVGGFPEEKLVRNRYIVDRYNKIQGYDNIYAIGILPIWKPLNIHMGIPQVANVAINQGKKFR